MQEFLIKEIEDLKAKHYAEMVDLGMENFKLKQQLRKQKIKRAEAIAELKEEIKKTQEIANEQTFKLCVEKENVWQLEELLRKQKRKRCLAMAKACHFMMAMRLFPNKEYVRKWAERGNKWIDLADKFKG